MPHFFARPTSTSNCIGDDRPRDLRLSVPAADFEAIVPAAGQGTRLGLGPKAFIVLAGRTLLEHAVTMALSVAARATVAVPAADLARAEDLVAGPAVRVLAGGARRVDTMRLLANAATAPWLLLHDVVHPFVTTELAQQVIDKARLAGAATAALPNADFLYGADGAPQAAPGTVVAIQKPSAFRRADLLRGFELADANATGGALADQSTIFILSLAGQKAALVPGHSLNYKLTTSSDLALARRLMVSG